MSVRDRFLETMRRQSDGYIPFELDFCPSKLDEFEVKTGTRDYFTFYGIPFRWIGAHSTEDSSRYTPYYASLDFIHLDDWGVGYKAGSVAHFTHMQHPMEHFTTLADFEAYPYPDPVKDYDWAGVAADVDSVKERGLASVAGLQITLFEIAWYLRGMETFMIDMALNPDLAAYHLDRITSARVEFARRYAAAGCDVLFLGDDIATQLNMMISPSLWRQHIKPRLFSVIQAAKKVRPEILIAYHSDGNIAKVIPELIEIGVEILNPIQPECMDVLEIKRLYGSKLSFWGALGTQTTLPFGSVSDVKKACLDLIMQVGQGGGLLLAPTHTIEPEVPWDNIQGFLDTVNEYNEKHSKS